MRQSVTRERDQALRRLRRTTSVVLATAGALVAAFAGLAAKALPGRHAVKAAQQPTAHRAQQQQRQATPPPLVPVQGGDSGAAPPATPASPAAPASPPVQTQAPPVAVSGGT